MNIGKNWKVLFGIGETIIEISDVRRSIGYGKQKADGSHDHRTNKGKDRTPAQKDADGRRPGRPVR